MSDKKLKFFCTKSKEWYKMNKETMLGELRCRDDDPIPCCVKCNLENGVTLLNEVYV